MSREQVWTVEVQTSAGNWSDWCQWVDRSTAEEEKAVAEDEGFVARIVDAS